MEANRSEPLVHASVETGVPQPKRKEPSVVETAERKLAEHPLFCGRTATIRWAYDRGTLIVSGSVPSFYLKQVVQELVRHLDGVQRVDNRIDVVSPRGLSSVAADHQPVERRQGAESVGK